MGMNVHEIQTGKVHTLLSITSGNNTGSSYLKPAKVASIQVTGVGGGTVTVDVSNNDSDWINVITTTVTGGWVYDEPYKYIRASNSGYASGTAEVLMGV